MLWIAVYFASGLVVGSYFDIGSIFSLIAALILGAACIAWRKGSTYLLPFTFLLLGLLCYELEGEGITDNRIRRIYDDGRIESHEPVEIEGVLLGPPEPSYGGVFLLLGSEKLTFQSSGRGVSGKIRLFVPLDDDLTRVEFRQLDLGYGSRIGVYCRLEREEKYKNPGVASLIDLLDRQETDATATVKSPLLIEKIGDESVFLPLGWLHERRQRLIEAFNKNLSPPTAGVMIASLLGDDNFLDRRTADVFREGGTFHVLVISGLHITFIGGIVLWLVSFFSPRKVLQFVLAASFLWAYTLAVGAEVPVVRASIMFTILLFSHLLHRTGSQLNALGTCVLIVLVWRPDDLFSASFQLTIVSVASIVGCAFPLIEKLRAIGSWIPTAEDPLPPAAARPLRRFCEFLYWNDTSWKIENSRQIWSANLFKSPYLERLTAPNLKVVIAYVFEGLLVSLIVQIWMLPLLVIYFHRISPASLFLNLWVSIFLALESFAAIAAVLINEFSTWLAAPLCALTEFLNTSMVSVPSWVSEMGFASFRLPAYSGQSRVIYFLYGSAITAAAIEIFRWNPFDRTGINISRWKLVASIALSAGLAIAIILHPYSRPDADGRLRVDFLDVGQGDSALVTFPDGETMLVDGGGRIEHHNADDDSFEPDTRRIGESVVSEFLWQKGYSRIDYLVATHSDADHMQGLSDVAQNFDVGLVLLGTSRADDPEFVELMKVIERRKILIDTVRRGDDFSIGGARVQILNPAGVTSFGVSPNNSSVVMKISFGNRAFLLTGDIERAAETDLASDIARDLHADVIKVPHHGSRTSSTEEFVRRANVVTAVISVGRRSRFGHPHAEVVARWQKAGAEVLKTGENGTITITTDGSDLQIQTFVP